MRPMTRRRRYTPAWIFRQWRHGCFCASPGRPWECRACTWAFLRALLLSCLTPWTWTAGPVRCAVCGLYTPAGELREGECVDCSH